MPHTTNITTTTTNNNNTNNNEIAIPLNTIKIPSNLSLKNESQIFIYIPNFTSIKLSQGKNFENGFWSIKFSELSHTNIIIQKNLHLFQLLFICNNINEEEITANIYYTTNPTNIETTGNTGDKAQTKTPTLYTGPFITASHTILSNNTVNLRLKSFTSPDTTIFDIQGLPSYTQLSTGTKIESSDHEIWQIQATKGQSINITLPPQYAHNKLNLNISATNKLSPQYKTTFTIIANLNDTHKTQYKSQYREIKINTFDILKKSNIPFDSFILAIKGLPEYCCIPHSIKIGNKWIINHKQNHQIIINNFNKTLSQFHITLEYIILNTQLQIPSLDNTYTTKIKCDFTNSAPITKDYTKCIICKNCDRCELFKNFMEYIGNSTILRHILK